jgi:hypothetical protein
MGGINVSSYADIKIILKMGGETIEFDNNRLTAFQIVKTFNDHFKISFKGEVTANQDKYYEMAVYEVHVEVYFNPANTLIFNGVLTRITVHPNREERTVQVEMEGASYTHYLDVNLFNRAFQDQAMTYQTLVDTITKTYYKALGEELANADKPIETFTLQYQETDWQFLKRMASRLHIGLVPEVTRENIKFYFGMPELKERGVLKEIAPFYGIRKRLRDYRELIASGISDVVEDDFLSFDFKTDELFNIGDYVYLDSDNKNAKLYVYQATMTLEGSLFRCYCAVSPLYGLKQKKTYNPRITGLSLEGKIVAVGGADSSKDYVKVLLPMGVSTDKEKACWFRYATPYTAAGNTGWYWMPEVNDSVLLYFPTCKEEEAMVTTSVRRQESESERLQDPNAAYLRTGFEKELLFKEGQITLTGKDQGLHIYLDQKQGITIESPSELGLQADNNLMLQAGRNLVISAQGDQSAIQLKHKDGKGNNLILNADGGIGFKGKVEKESGSGEMVGLEMDSSNKIKSDGNNATIINTYEVSIENMKKMYKKFCRKNSNPSKITPETIEKFKKANSLNDAETLYLCEMIAHYNTNFNGRIVDGKPATWCNAYAAYVLWLYTGSKDLMRGQSETISGNFRDPLVFYKQGKNDWWTLSASEIYTKLGKIAKVKNGDWEEVTDRQRAQDLADSGKFVVGISPYVEKVTDANTKKKSYRCSCCGCSTRKTVYTEDRKG